MSNDLTHKSPFEAVVVAWLDELGNDGFKDFVLTAITKRGLSPVETIMFLRVAVDMYNDFIEVVLLDGS